jgi:hypothetical protein
MNTKFLYNTVTCAIDALRKRGFNTDFELRDNSIVSGKTTLGIDDLTIEAFFRYEGNSDPADRASVYGLKSNLGIKGILVTTDDANAEVSSTALLRELHLKTIYPSRALQKA